MLKLKKLMNQKGFTLVELLIVIAVIGILAVAVLAALDPVEQIRKSRDTGKMADARELVNSYQRFYASKNCLPQEYSDGSATPCWTSLGASGEFTTSETDPGIVMMASADIGELKPNFPSRASVKGGQLFAMWDANKVVSVCFPAESKAARGDSMGSQYYVTAGSITATTHGTCAAPYSAITIDPGNCNICVQ